MFVKNCWYVAGWSHELNGGAIVARTVINAPLTIYLAEDGEPMTAQMRQTLLRLAAADVLQPA